LIISTSYEVDFGAEYGKLSLGSQPICHRHIWGAGNHRIQTTISEVHFAEFDAA
jgi:hypothetical protein